MRRCALCEQMVQIIRGRAVTLRRQGRTYKRIGELLDISPSLAYYYVERAKRGR
jgi:DNA-binding CsgD family transcriptional regulator